MKKNVSNLMRFLSLTIVLILVAPAMMDAQTGKVDFTGTWALNAEKSTLPQGGGGQRMGGGNFTVTQETNLMTQTRTGQDGTARVTKYTLDGKESVNATFGGESKSTAKWSADGKTLTIVTRSTYNGNEMISTAVWSLIDAKTLSIVSTRQGQDGEVKATMVYDKK
jgi:Tol biopolymer transport system component